MRKRIISVLLCVSMVLSMLSVSDLSTYAEDTEWQIQGNSGWTVAYPQNNQNDYLKDQQTGSGSVSQDIVGDETYPSTYIHFSDTEVAFRIRVSNIDGGNDDSDYQFKNFAFVGIDADVNGSVDFFLGAYNPTGNSGRLGIYSSNSGYANISPSTTGISGKPLLAFKPDRNKNFSIIKAADGSKFNTDDDYFISFKFKVEDITGALEGTGYSFNSYTPFCFMTGTAAQDNSFNQDINGMDKNGWSSGKTWSSLGVFSGAAAADGSAVYYTVKFDKNTGDTEPSPNTKVVAAGSAIGELPSSESLTKRGGYFFQGWNTQPDGSGILVTPETSITDNITVYAQWSKSAVYTVTFNYNYTGSPNGGIYATAETINGVVGVNMPDNPTRSGNSFAGWCIAPAQKDGDMFDATSDVKSIAPVGSYSATVYAIWSTSSKTPVLFYNNDTLVATVFPNGASTYAPILPSKTGYSFGGWTLTKGSTTVSIANGAKIPNGAVGPYYAIWTVAVIPSYNISFNSNTTDAVTDMPSQRTVTNALFGAMPNPEPARTGYDFIEWNTRTDGQGEAMYPTSSISASINVYAIWKKIDTISFHSNTTPDEIQTIPSVNGKLEYFPQPPYIDSYTFLGWGTSYDAVTVVDIADVRGHTDFYGVWSPVYNVIFDANSGDWGGTPAVTQTTVLTSYGSVLYIPDAPARADYTFSGWNTKANGSGIPFTLSTPVTENNSSVYAMWTPVTGTHKVQFETNGGSEVEDMTTNQIDTEPVSTKTGYSLEGWYDDPGMAEESKVSFPYSVTADKILYAKWTADTYTVTLNKNGGSGGSSSITATYDQPMPDASAPERDGYKFIGYFDQPSSGAQYYDNDMDSAKDWDKTGINEILYARWEANKYKVIFDANGGQYSDDTDTVEIEQTYDSKYVLPSENPTWSGYEFASWNMQEDGEGQTITENTDVKLTVAQAVYAVWTEEGYVTINYASSNDDYGTVGRDSESLNPYTGVPNGSEATASTGYHFAGWEDSEGNQVSADESFVPEMGNEGAYESATYIAVFLPDDDTAYTVEHYVMNTEGSYPSDAEKTDNNTGTTDELLTLEDLVDDSLLVQDGITYAYGTVDSTNTGFTTIKPDGTLLIKLYYARSQHVLTLSKGTGISDVTGGGTYYYGQSVNITATVDTGYTWDKWESSNTTLLADQANQNTSFTIPAGNCTLTSRTAAEASSYSITYDLKGGTTASPNPTAYSAEDEAFTLINPTKTGYTFRGWMGTGLTGAVMTVTVQKGSTGNLSYTATWEAKSYDVTLDDNGGSGGSGSVTTVYDQPMPAAEKPVKDGYIFDGYYDAEDGGTRYYDADMNSEHVWNKTGSGTILYARWTAHDVMGTMVDDETPAKIISGATVIIVKGNTQYGNTATTDSEGNFTILGVPAGTYNLIMTVGDKTEIIAITVRGDIPVTNIGVVIFPLGNASSALKLQGNGTPAVVVGNLHPEAEDYFVEEGEKGFVKIEMTIARTDEETASSNGDTGILNAINRIKIEAQNAGVTIGLYLDMIIDKYQRTDEALPWNHVGNITRTNGLVQVIIPLPEALQGKSAYYVYQYHGNEVNIINTIPNEYGEYLTLDSSDWTLTLNLRRFSVYAIAFSDQSVYTVEHYVMETDGSYPAYPTKTNVKSGAEGSSLVLSDLQDDSLLVTNVIAYAYGTVDGTRTATTTVEADSSLIIKLYYERQSSSGGGGTTYYTVTFNGNGGYPEVMTQSVARGSILAKPADPTRSGYSFTGWYRSDGSEWSFSTDKVNSNTTLTAGWTKTAQDTGKPVLDKVNHIAYMQGYPDKNFGPERNMTRAEVTVMFARLLTEKMDVDKTYSSSFKDVKAAKWYANAIGYMEKYGIIGGYPDGTFKPEAPITRAEFAAIASRFDTMASGKQSNFADIAESYWAKAYISSAAEKGWIKGYPNGTFKPENRITRAEVVTFVNRMLERYCDRSYAQSNTNGLKRYEDLSSAYWAYFDIMEASNGHKYEKASIGETWSGLAQ